MKKLWAGAVILGLAAGASAWAAPAERWLHVRVEEGRDGGETVHVNVPLTLAEKVLPAIQADRFQNGKVRLDRGDMKNVDLRAILEAVRDTRDGEFVTVQKGKDDVRVAKEKGRLVVKVREEKSKGGTRVDVQVPMDVVEALLSGGGEELDVAAAIRALARHSDEVFVTVHDEGSNVRIWVDSQNISE
jgi:hypothetical protein